MFTNFSRLSGGNNRSRDKKTFVGNLVLIFWIFFLKLKFSKFCFYLTFFVAQFASIIFFLFFFWFFNYNFIMLISLTYIVNNKEYSFKTIFLEVFHCSLNTGSITLLLTK